MAFPDHHQYTDRDWEHIVATASHNKARLVTTMKDYMRLDPKQRQHVTPLPLTLDINKTWINTIFNECRHD
jgi:tetraacyldisaccharide-1-P 4'-kinase